MRTVVCLSEIAVFTNTRSRRFLVEGRESRPNRRRCLSGSSVNAAPVSKDNRSREMSRMREMGCLLACAAMRYLMTSY